MRRLHRSSGNTELTDSGSQSLTISGHPLARLCAADSRVLEAAAHCHRQARANRVSLATDIQLAAASIEARYPDLLDPKSPYPALFTNARALVHNAPAAYALLGAAGFDTARRAVLETSPGLVRRRVCHRSRTAPERCCVVSRETSAAERRKPPKDHYIPDVCRELGVPCINLLGPHEARTLGVVAVSLPAL
jgi:hypothetical protein